MLIKNAYESHKIILRVLLVCLSPFFMTRNLPFNIIVLMNFLYFKNKKNKENLPVNNSNIKIYRGRLCDPVQGTGGMCPSPHPTPFLSYRQLVVQLS